MNQTKHVRLPLAIIFSANREVGPQGGDDMSNALRMITGGDVFERYEDGDMDNGYNALHLEVYDCELSAVVATAQALCFEGNVTFALTFESAFMAFGDAELNLVHLELS